LYSATATIEERDMGKSKIEWTDMVLNVVTGCTKVSAGCKNCYAERIANRFWWEERDELPRQFSDVRVHPERLKIPAKWKTPKRIFICSMGDLFHKYVPFEFIARVFHMTQVYNQHTYIILTKRIERALEFWRWWEDGCMNGIDPFDNVWFLVSVENQKTADERIPLLLKMPAVIRGVSYEPALGEVNFDGYLADHSWEHGVPGGLNWVVAGAESGPGARPADIDWFRSVRDQCQAAGVTFFLKQMVVDGKLVKMPALDGEVWEAYPK
jgi:protein gp37